MLGEKTSDGRRRAAETEFYEHKDENGIVRRTSLIRSVDKDDKLLVRGANPRTGMITPTDTISLAGSAEGGKQRSRIHPTQSAKWKLQGDQWISINDGQTRASPQSKMPGGYHKARRCASENVPRSKPYDQKTAKSLTSENLVALEKLAEQQQVGVMPSQNDSQLNLPKVRRKAIGSPSKYMSKVVEHTERARVHDRIASDGTVVRRRLKSEEPQRRVQQLSKHDYFSPDNVGRGVRRHLRSDRSDNSLEEQSFLGVPVKSQLRTQSRPRGFTVTNENHHSLWPDLQMNDGPYPSKPSINRQVPSLAYYHQRMCKNVEARELQRNHESQTKFPLLAQKASHPNGATLLVQKPQRPPQGLHNMQYARLHMSQRQLGQVDNLGEDLQPLNWTRGSPLRQKSDILFMSTGMSTHMFSEHADLNRKKGKPSPSPIVDEYTSPMSKKFRDQCTLAESPPHRLRDIDGIAGKNQHTIRNLPRNIPLHSQNIGMTTMELENLSRKTGTISQGNHVTPTAQKDPDLKVLGDILSRACPSPAYSETTSPSAQLSTPTEAASQTEADETSSVDHSKCCSECCDQFDCHESCLGHSSLDAAAEKSDTFNFTSAGIFDESFQTSVKVVNEALLTDWKNGDSKLVKVKNASVQGWCYSLGITSKSPVHEDRMKKTLRSPPVRQRYDPMKRQPKRPVLSSPKTRNVGNAQTAAQIAMCDEKQPNDCSRPTNPKTSRVLQQAGSPQTPRSKKEVRKVSDKQDLKAVRTSKEPIESSEVRCEIDRPRASDPTASDCDYVNVKSQNKSLELKLDSIVDVKSESLIDLQKINSRYKVIERARIVRKKVHQMSLVVLETTFTSARVISKYNQHGAVVLPEGVSAFEFWGNFLRSILYLMIGACVYALILRISRVVWSFLTVLLIPFRVYTWIVG